MTFNPYNLKNYKTKILKLDEKNVYKGKKGCAQKECDATGVTVVADKNLAWSYSESDDNF